MLPFFEFAPSPPRRGLRYDMRPKLASLRNPASRARQTDESSFCAATVPSKVSRGLRQLSHAPQRVIALLREIYPQPELWSVR